MEKPTNRYKGTLKATKPIFTPEILEMMETRLRAGDKLELRIVDGMTLGVWVETRKRLQ